MPAPKTIRRPPIPDATPSNGPDPYGNPDPEWLKIDWSAHRSQVEVAGRPVNYVEMRPPRDQQHPLALLFVHGLSGCWQNWLENIPHFARRHRVLALDLPGFGDSPPPQGEITISNYAGLVGQFADAVGINDCAIVGNSMGGFIAAESAVAQPGRFEKLVLVSAAGVSSTRLKRQPTAVVARMLNTAGPLAFKAQTRAFRRAKARVGAFSGIFDDPARIRAELIWEVFTGGDRGEKFVEALTSLASYDILDRLEEVEVPALIVWGRQDKVVPPRDALEYETRLRNSQLEVFERCGHLPMAERPVRFNRVLEEFVSR